MDKSNPTAATVPSQETMAKSVVNKEEIKTNNEPKTTFGDTDKAFFKSSMANENAHQQQQSPPLPPSPVTVNAQPNQGNPNAAISVKSTDDDQLAPVDSTVSIGFCASPTDTEDGTQTLVIRDGPESYKSILRTVIAYAIQCPHFKLAVQKMKGHTGYWLPYAYTTENARYLDTVNLVYDFFLDEFKNVHDQSFAKNPNANETSNGQTNEEKPAKKDGATFLSNLHMFSIFRFQIPNGLFITRYIYLAQWAMDSKTGTKVACCKDTANIQWLSIDAILQESQTKQRQLMNRLWGPEIMMVSDALKQLHLGTLDLSDLPQIDEITSNKVMKYLSRKLSGQCLSDSSTQLLQEAKFSEKDVIKIYGDFVQHCYPAAAMTYCSFYEYFTTKIGFFEFDDDSLPHIYRAWNLKNKRFLTFKDFLLGLAALDSNAPNSNFRFRYIFRYYDRNGDKFLDEEDFKRMIYDIRYRANLSCDPNEVANDVKSRLSILKLMDESKRISYKAFLNEASHIGGIMHLFRTNKAILKAIHTRHAYELLLNKNGKQFGPRLVGTCAKCRPRKYSLAYHAVKLNATGRIDEPKALVDLNCGDIDTELQFKQKADQMELAHSIEVVFHDNIANKVLNAVRKMADIKQMPQAQLEETHKLVMSTLTPATIAALCEKVIDILLVEPRVVKVNTPCIVLGDLHGNLHDLLIYDRQLWPLAPSAHSPNVLFLGDYVDRGDYSVEVASYLFAMKILAPTKFYLLRGNHESRSIQKQYTFYKEIEQKYNLDKDVQTVFETFNRAFDCLPLVGIIDQSIYCAHGGIPHSTNKMEDLYQIPVPLYEPGNQSKAAWEIIWSDPLPDEEYQEVMQFSNKPDDGFVDNLRRGCANFFNEKALRNFLENNGLSHVIRAHELEAPGFRFVHSGLCITVFSSSRYCGGKNRAAAAFVDSHGNKGFIKIISLET